jgi:acetolactate synthase-1/2/3 large subunit
MRDLLGRLARARRVEQASDLGALQRALANAPALIDVLTSQSLSSDARKGLGFVYDYKALTAWDEAERKRRESC